MMPQGVNGDHMRSTDLPQGLDIQQMLLNMDPNNQAMAYMSQLSGLQSSPPPEEEKSPAPNDLLPPWLGMFQNQQNNSMPSMTALLEQMQSMQGVGLGLPPQQLSALLGQFQNQKSPMQQRRKETSPSQSPMNHNFPMGGMPFAVPASTSAAQSVIVEREDLTPPAQKRSRQEDDENQSPIKSQLDSLMASMGGLPCDDCGEKFPNTFALLTHKAKEHQPKSEDCAYKCVECEKEFDSQQNLDQHSLLQHGGIAQAQRLLSGLLPNGFPLHFMMGQPFPMPDMDSQLAQLNTPKPAGGVKRQYSSNGKNYCDLCNKEVCNKYFLRTHMLKMHGIVIDENKVMIANIDTLEKERMGALSFRCDICHMEMKSRQLLRQHKQEQHGVVPITPNGRPVEQNGLSFDRTDFSPLQSLFSSMNPTKPLGPPTMVSMNEDKSSIEKRLLPVSLSENTNQESSLIECKFCPATFSHEVEHHLHNIQKHVITDFTQKEEKKAEVGTLRCSQCQYSTKDAKNMEMHAERHERLNEVKAQNDDDEDEALQMTTEVALQMVQANQQDRFKCVACPASYTDEASLDAHASMMHNGLNLSLPKKDDTEKLPNERNSHTSGSISPSTESLPEGFGKLIHGVDKPFPMQAFILRTTDPEGVFLGEVMVHLPVRAVASETRQVTFEVVPTPQVNQYQC